MGLQEAGGTMQMIEQQLGEQQKIEAKAQSNLKNQKDALTAEQKKLKDIRKQCGEVSIQYFKSGVFSLTVTTCLR